MYYMKTFSVETTHVGSDLWIEGSYNRVRSYHLKMFELSRMVRFTTLRSYLRSESVVNF